MMADEMAADPAAGPAGVEALVGAEETSLDRWSVEQTTFEPPRSSSANTLSGLGRLVLRKGPHKGAIVPEEWRDF